MITKLKTHQCRYCGINLIDKDVNGKLRFGKHLKECPTTLAPKTEGPARKLAKSRLICGDLCVAPNSDITDIGNGLSHCSKCKGAADLAREAQASYMKNNGKSSARVEYIHPAPRKTVEHWKRLYLSLLQKHALTLEELEQLKRSRR